MKRVVLELNQNMVCVKEEINGTPKVVGYCPLLPEKYKYIDENFDFVCSQIHFWLPTLMNFI